MNVGFVADIGNTRMKWAVCRTHVEEMVSLPPDDPREWTRQLDTWDVAKNSIWAVASVHPERTARFLAWLSDHQQRGFDVSRFPLKQQGILVEAPEKVGADRLMNWMAVRSGGQFPAAIIGAGSAVTVDLVDEMGRFLGGAILPGFSLMSKALHDCTAQLPMVTVTEPIRPPGKNTEAAIACGVFHAIYGGIAAIVESYRQRFANLHVYFTGGDAELLGRDWPGPFRLWPEMTLEGIRIAASAMEETAKLQAAHGEGHEC